MFEGIDSDGDNTISLDEFRKAMGVVSPADHRYANHISNILDICVISDQYRLMLVSIIVNYLYC